MRYRNRAEPEWVVGVGGVITRRIIGCPRPGTSETVDRSTAWWANPAAHERPSERGERLTADAFTSSPTPGLWGAFVLKVGTI